MPFWASCILQCAIRIFEPCMFHRSLSLPKRHVKVVDMESLQEDASKNRRFTHAKTFGIVVLIHTLIWTPMIASMILTPMTMKVLFSSPIAVEPIKWSLSPGILGVGLVSYIFIMGVTFLLCKIVTIEYVYSLICILSGSALALGLLCASEDTYSAFLWTQFIQIALVGTANFVMPLYVRDFIPSDMLNMCMGLIRISTSITSFLAVVWGSYALGNPFFDRTVTDPLVVQTHVNTWFVAMALLQVAAVTSIHVAQRCILSHQKLVR